MSEIHQFKRWFWIALISWVFLVSVSFIWNARQSWQSMLDQGRSEGRMAFMRDLSYRIWNARQGGVYVQISKESPPNPYLKVEHRDVVTTKGKKLTLINPAYMTRLVLTLTEEMYGIKGHLTSLKLLNPGNAPDEWEKQCLTSFEEDPAEITQFMSIDGEPFLRFMRPLITRKTCLECHRDMGYKEGDVRGGISVSVPMSAHIASAKKIILHLAIAHLILLLIGMGTLLFSRKRVTKYFKAKEVAEKQANEERERLDVTLRSIGDGVIATDLDGKIVLINKIIEQLTGWSQQEAIGRRVQEVFHIINEKTGKPCDNPVDKVIVSGKIVGLAEHTALIARDGTQYSIEDSGAPIFDKENKIIGAVLVFRDVTEERKTAEELLKVKKLESVGLLAGGIAHDFNNILAAILGNIELAAMSIDSTSKVYSLLQEAKKASLRATGLTQQLLTFSQGGAPVKKTTPIGKVIIESANFVLHGSPVSCWFNIPDDLWLVDIDAGQISQVIQNLVINAKHSMPEGGEIRINCTNIADIRSETSLRLPGTAYIKIIVQDNGCGITKKHLEKIFDPYFTTRQEGSGLGLAITHAIISKHNGHIAVQSKKCEGTTFTIYLPVYDKQIAHEPIKAAGKPEDAVRARILVMDDEQVVLDVARQMLAHLGHEVLQAKDGREAIDIFIDHRKSGKPVDIIIMDLTVPGGMGGKEAMPEILKIDPEAKVIVSSGYSNDAVMANYRQHGFKAAIAKPFLLEELNKALTDALS